MKIINKTQQNKTIGNLLPPAESEHFAPLSAHLQTTMTTATHVRGLSFTTSKNRESTALRNEELTFFYRVAFDCFLVTFNMWRGLLRSADLQCGLLLSPCLLAKYYHVVNLQINARQFYTIKKKLQAHSSNGN